MHDEEDEGFGRVANPGALSSLFGGGGGGSAETPSLKFTAPKAPKPAQAKPAQPAASAQPQPTVQVVNAATVHLFRLGSSGAYEAVGQAGFAILGGKAAPRWQLLLYDAQRKPYVTLTIQPSFVFQVNPDLYCGFRDEQGTAWSLKFATADEIEKAARQIAFARAVAWSDTSSLIVQDLALGKGHDVAAGDSVQVRYTGWLQSDEGRHAVGQVFDSNASASGKPFKFKVAEGKVIKGWDEGVVGMKKEGRRMLIVPPHLGYGNNGAPGRIPPNAVLYFEILCERHKRGESGSVPQQSPSHDTVAPSAPATPPISAVSSPADPIIAGHHDLADAPDSARRRSSVGHIAEQMRDRAGSEDMDEDRQRLRARMAGLAKAGGMMGMPGISAGGTLPARAADPHVPVSSMAMVPVSEPASMLDQALAAHSSEATEVSQQHHMQHAANHPHVQQQQQQPHHGHSGIQLQLQSVVQQQQQYQAPLSSPASAYALEQQQQQQQHVVPSQTPRGFAPTSDASQLQWLLESRASQQEAGLLLKDIQRKMDELSTKMDTVAVGAAKKSNLDVAPDQILVGQAMVASVQRLVDENERLRNDMAEKREQVLHLSQQLEEAFEQRKKLENRVERVTAEVHQAEATEALKLKIAALETAKEATRAELQALSEAKEADQQRCLELQRELKDERTAKKQALDQLAAAREELDDEREAKERFAKAVEDRKKKMQEERLQWEAAQEEATAAHAAEVQRMRDLVHKTRMAGGALREDEIATIQAEMEAKAAKALQEQEQIFRAEIAERFEKEVGTRIAKREAEIRASLQEEIDQLKLQLEKAAEGAAAALRENSETLEELRQKSEANAAAAVESAKMQAADDLRAALEQAQSTFDARIAELEEEKSSAVSELQARVANLENQLATAQDTQAASHAVSSQEMDDLRAAALEAKEALAAVEAEKNALQEQLAQVIEQAKERIAVMNTQLETAESEKAEIVETAKSHVARIKEAALAQTGETLKQAMSDVYFKLEETLAGEGYITRDVLQVLMAVIKAVSVGVAQGEDAAAAAFASIVAPSPISTSANHVHPTQAAEDGGPSETGADHAEAEQDEAVEPEQGESETAAEEEKEEDIASQQAQEMEMEEDEEKQAEAEEEEDKPEESPKKVIKEKPPLFPDDDDDDE